MSADGRTQEQIRLEMEAERTQLAEALGDLRRDVAAKRRLAVRVGEAVAVGVAAAAAVKLLLRR